ncbi:PVC-type heme-binding CxxCH protein [Limnoglobus roseus]|uniref:Putative beta-propeller-type glycoside hydrolase n=1 Tax=Limnoglobus roseus TaxID=2598579 RepID=A0A5C1AAR1_9BACT|nr:PVC-type heme-binding CxxCH protein [Limnoglobus roseus]QEL14118.1 putative beta-propeller-type glycoside hydrolase [Limnoglobus roseus]
MLKHWSAALTAVLLLSSLASAQLPPDKALASMKAGDGLQVELFASEPMLINPTSIDVDHLGRVWVAEAVNYRRKMFKRPMLREEGDRVVILTDKDGDGKADESTVFYQGPELYGPLSVCVIPQANAKAVRVLVAQSPDILEFWDKDGDGKADGPPTKFLTGFGGYDHDHGVHGLNVGPDGKLYFTVGDGGLTGLQSKDGKGPKFVSNNTTIQKGTVWRCDLDGNNVELIAHNFRNNYECCVDSFGEIWLSDNDDDGNQQTRICHVMPGGNYGYGPRGPGQSHWHEEQPGIVHKTLRTGFGSPTGITFYEGNLLPKQYQGELIHADAGPREIRSFKRKPKGAGYELDKALMLTSSDNWFRPSDVCVAPDGSVFVADWYDPGVGGHGMGDWTRGRIYRLTPAGHKGYTVPEVKLDDAKGMVTALASPNLTARYLATQQISSQMRKNDAGLDLATGAHTVEPNPAVWYRFLHLVVSRMPSFTGEQQMAIRLMLSPMCKSKENNLNALDHMLIQSGPSWLPKIADPDRMSQVGCAMQRRDALLTLNRAEAGLAKAYFYPLAKLYDGQDIFYRAALNIACGTDPVRRDAILADFDKQFPEWNDKVADLVWELRPKSMLPKLHALLVNSKLTASQKARVVDILAASDDTTAGMVMFDLLKGDAPAEVKSRALDNLKLFLPTKWNALTKGDDLSKAVAGLLADAKTRTTGLQLVAAGNVTGQVEAVAKVAADAKLELPQRFEAIRTLGQLKTLASVEALIGMGAPQSDITGEVIQALGKQLPVGSQITSVQQKALEALQMAITLPGAKPETKSAALNALAGSRVGTNWLLSLQEKKELPAEIFAEAGRLLRNSPFAIERNKAMILFPAPGKLDPKKLPPIAELAKRKGNADIGKAVLAKSVSSEVQCLKCHMVRGTGGQIGPDLSMIGKKASRENLFESILLPSKAVADQYVSWKLDSEDGQSITGLIVGETETTITLRDANGKDYPFPVKGTERKKSLTSIMPEGLAATLTEDELVDVVEYLTKLQTPSYTPDSWMVMGPFKSPDGNGGLTRGYGPEQAKFDAKATFLEWPGPASGKKPKDLSWQLVRPGANGYVDLAKLHGDNSKNSVSFAYKEIDSPEDVEITLLFGTDDGAVVYVNGKDVYSHKQAVAAAPEQHSAKVKFTKGKNTVMLKIANGDNPHGFYFTVEGLPEAKK